jgi:hypothetical protein
MRDLGRQSDPRQAASLPLPISPIPVHPSQIGHAPQSGGSSRFLPKDDLVLTHLKVARRVVRKIVLTVRSATARRPAIDPLGGPGPGDPPLSGGGYPVNRHAERGRMPSARPRSSTAAPGVHFPMRANSRRGRGAGHGGGVGAPWKEAVSRGRGRRVDRSPGC